MIRPLLIAAFLATPAVALELNLPATARQTSERNTSPDTYLAPIGPFENGRVPVRTVEGNVRRTAWRLASPGLTPLQVMRPLRAQLEQAGYDIVLDCATAACGGFDFRFSVETLPGPNMYVNLRAFHFVTGTSPDGNNVVTILASTSATSAHVQIIQAGTVAQDAVTVDTPAVLPGTTQTVEQDGIAAQLLGLGHAVLADLDFETGSTKLGTGPFSSLEQLAAFLKAQPTVRVALVGHTDTVGSLEGNIAISRQRAGSVRQRLIDTYGIANSRLDAEGMGYLAPVASNLDAEGRDLNRRVEVILLGTK
tara:strand:- start:567 stop:1490 length:924 start_codon:yes stop_codon:yes gene_type:complete